MKETTFIYALVDPTTEQVRYVGKSNNPGKRLTCHATSFHGNHHKINWIKKLQNEGLRPTLLILEEVSIEQWREREMYWIAFYREHGNSLVNKNEGGTGQTTLTSEHRAKIGIAGKGKKRTPESRVRIALANKERANRPESKARMSKKFKGKPLDPDAIAKIKATKKAQAATPEGRANIEKMLANKPSTHSPETLAKKSETMRAKYEAGWDIGEEARAKISAAKKGIPRSPEVVAKMSAGAKGKKRGPMSEAHKAALSAAKRGKPNPKLSESRQGKPTNNPRCSVCGRFLDKAGLCSACTK